MCLKSVAPKKGFVLNRFLSAGRSESLIETDSEGGEAGETTDANETEIEIAPEESESDGEKSQSDIKEPTSKETAMQATPERRNVRTGTENDMIHVTQTPVVKLGIPGKFPSIIIMKIQ